MTDPGIVLRGGRVIDPETGLDGIRAWQSRRAGSRRWEPWSPGAGRGKRSGHVVTAGFVDRQSHQRDSRPAAACPGRRDDCARAGSHFAPVDLAYRQAAAEGRPLNYGFATSWALARMEIVAGLDLASNFDFSAACRTGVPAASLRDADQRHRQPVGS